MERAKAFYTALGLQLTWDAADWAYLQSPLTGDGIALLSPDYTAAGPHFAFHLDDRAAVDAVHARLSASGVSVGPVLEPETPMKGGSGFGRTWLGDKKSPVNTGPWNSKFGLEN